MTDSDLPWSTSEIDQEVKIHMGKGQAGIPKLTVMQMFDECLKVNATKPAIHQKKPLKGGEYESEWTTWTFKQFRENVDGFAKSLISLGLEKFDCINIIGFNSPEWLFADIGAIAAGCVPAGIYATNLPEACKHITAHSKAKVVVCEGIHQLEKFYEISKDLPDLKALVMYGPDDVPDDIKEKCPVPVHKFGDFLKLGTDVSNEDLKKRSNSWKFGETCTLIYTSGTTGPPKAVMVTNDNITWTTRTMLTLTPRGRLDNTDHMISYLPLSHIAAQTLDIYNPISSGCQIWFARPDALKGSLGATLKDVRPTIFFGVPRVWEKIYDKMQEVAKSSTGLKAKLSAWAKGKAALHWQSRQYGNRVQNPPCYFIAKKLLHKAHVALGLDRCQVCYVAAAPIDVKILKYFCSINVPIMEIFGQSECCGPHTANKLDAVKIGSVGRPLPGTETRNDNEHGELRYRGRHIFAGYMYMPDKTKETIDPDGWLYSGDVVRIDKDKDPNDPNGHGFVYITGRIKELIITAGGENVPPVLIEDQFKAAMPALSNCMVIGDKRKFLSILLCLTVEIDENGTATNKLTGRALEVGKEIGSSATTTEEAAKDEKWQKYFDEGMKKANDAATSRAQKVGKWSLLPTDFTEIGGELTPTLKLKRPIAEKKYSDQVEAIYA